MSSNLIGPIFTFRSSVLCPESCCFTNENLLETKLKDEWYLGLFGCSEFWALLQSNTKPERKQIKQLWAPSKPVLEYFGRYLPKQRLVRAIKILSDARKRRFLRRRQPKYGSMNKGFTEEELVKFFNALEDPKMILLFSFQAILGLRIGECVRIHLRDLRLKTKELRIDTEKGQRIDYLPIPPQLFEQTMQFISDYEDEIMKRDGYIFWAEHYPKRNRFPHVSPDHARNVFMKTIKKARLDEVYSYSDQQKPKLLHRLTTHSLRHYAITNHARKNNGNVFLTSKFARHRDLKTTMIYVHTDRKELYESVMNAQEEGVLAKVRRMQERT